jgi:hypothetical protein
MMTKYLALIIPILFLLFLLLFFFLLLVQPMVSVTLSENATTQTKFKYGLELKEHPAVELGSNQSLVKIQAAALNHR